MTSAGDICLSPADVTLSQPGGMVTGGSFITLSPASRERSVARPGGVPLRLTAVPAIRGEPVARSLGTNMLEAFAQADGPVRDGEDRGAGLSGRGGDVLGPGPAVGVVRVVHGWISPDRGAVSGWCDLLVVASRVAGPVLWVEVTTRTPHGATRHHPRRGHLTGHDSELGRQRVDCLGAGPVVATGPASVFRAASSLHPVTAHALRSAEWSCREGVDQSYGFDRGSVLRVPGRGQHPGESVRALHDP